MIAAPFPWPEADRAAAESFRRQPPGIEATPAPAIFAAGFRAALAHASTAVSEWGLTGDPAEELFGDMARWAIDVETRVPEPPVGPAARAVLAALRQGDRLVLGTKKRVRLYRSGGSAPYWFAGVGVKYAILESLLRAGAIVEVETPGLDATTYAYRKEIDP